MLIMLSFVIRLLSSGGKEVRRICYRVMTSCTGSVSKELSNLHLPRSGC